MTNYNTSARIAIASPAGYDTNTRAASSLNEKLPCHVARLR